MDWAALATSLAENSAAPVVALDLQGRVQLFNTAFEHLTGWHRSEVLGAPWIDAFVAPDRAAIERARLSDALRGALRRYDCQIRTRGGRDLRISIEASRVGGTENGALVITVLSTAAVQPVAERLGCEVDYEVASDLGAFGTIRRVTLMGVEAPELIGQKCHLALYGRESVCAGCPLVSPEAGAWPRIIVRQREGGFQVVTGTCPSAGTVHVSVRSLPEHALSKMLEARIAQIGAEASLSDREQVVLRYLVMGRSLEDVAIILGIRARTVKFHQANILDKLGADSRVDLMRLIF
jgi:PAS domain S-box-containing protein